jgi:hypothetical protein
MPSDFDANIKLLYAVDAGGGFFTIDDVANGAEFVMVANVEIGADLNQNVDSFDLRVGIRNLTQSVTVATVNDSGTLTPDPTPAAFFDERRVTIPAGWGPAEVGDVLQAVAAYIVTAGANKDFSTAESQTFVVS